MEIRQGWYKHYQGSYFKVINIMQYVDSNYYSEEIVYEDKLGIRWTQPLETFFGTVIVGKKIISKITYVGGRLPKIIVAE